MPAFSYIQSTKAIRTAWAVLAALALLSLPASAQWLPWADDAFGDRRRGSYDRRPFVAPPDSPYDRRPSVGPPESRPTPRNDVTQQGGPRPVIAPQTPQVVAFSHDYPAASIVIDTSARRLYYVLPEGRAYEYPISVGREGFNWTGSETISRKQEWPDWHPPEEMRQRDPKLPEKMTGGIRNPLGAMALYLGNTLYRIHGTNDVKSIGQAQSSGCFRMMNSAVVHLASLVEVGAAVTVVARLPQQPAISRADDARQQASRAEEARQQASRAEEARQQASRAEEARQQASRAEEARQQASRAEEARQQASRAEEARQQASRAEEARQQASRAEEARQQASRAEEARQQASRAEEARQQASRAEEARQQAALPPLSRPPADRGEAGAGAPASGRDYRALREYMMGR